MRSTAVVAVAVVVVVVATVVVPPVSAQWTNTDSGGTTFAQAVSAGGVFHIGIGCLEGGNAVLLSMLDDGMFHNGGIEAEWDDGSRDTYTFQDRNDTLIASTKPEHGAAGGYSPEISGFIGKLRRHGAVVLRATKGRSQPVSDRMGLAGSSRAIDGLGCGPGGSAPEAAAAVPDYDSLWVREPEPPRPQRGIAQSGSMSRMWLGTIQGGLDSPMERILPQMPDDITPERRQSGQDRIFTYPFEDGSSIILTFRPSGAGQGLSLYTVDVRDLDTRWQR